MWTRSKDSFLLLFQMDIRLSQYCVLKRPHYTPLSSLTQSKWPYICGSISEFSILLVHLFLFMSLEHFLNYCKFILILISGSEISPTFFLFKNYFDCFSAILDIKLPVSTKIIWNFLIYLFLTVLGLHCYLGLSLVLVSGAALLLCMGFSLGWLLLLRSTGFRHVGSVVAARGL